MGSLMGGWDSPSPRSKTGKGGFERNKSLTKEEIDNYWKVKRKSEEEHLKAVAEAASLISKDDTLVIQTGGSGNLSAFSTPPPRLEVSKSFSGRDTADAVFVKDVELIRKMKAWWTRSNWAFLNEPPLTEMEGPAYKYAAQYHVAALGGQKQDISTDGVATTF